MSRQDLEQELKLLSETAWEREVNGPVFDKWAQNFSGSNFDSVEEEQNHALFALTKFIYFGKPLVRELLRALYRDHFKAPLMQRIRKDSADTRDLKLLQQLYEIELNNTRFIGVGNPSESGAHLLYYFRQVNRLKKDLFGDIHGIFSIAPDMENRDVKGISINRKALKPQSIKKIRASL